MYLHKKPWLVLALTTLLVSGCLTLAGGASKAQPRAQIDQYQLSEQVAISSSGCHFRYRHYHPDQLRSQTTVILGHGFMRNQNTMVDLARALANQGIAVATLNFCNMRPWNGQHKKNAADMQDLARELGVDSDVIYAGFSAGALAAVLAADNHTRAILALDLVDQKSLGLNAISQLETPLIGIAGDNSSCNANGNGHALFAARDNLALSELQHQTGASHCEFESPSNWLCELACGDKDAETTATTTRTHIIEQSIKSIGPFLSPLNPVVDS